MVERGFQPLITIKEAIENIDKIFIYYLLSKENLYGAQSR